MIGHISARAILASPIANDAVWTESMTGNSKTIRVVVSRDVEYFNESVIERRTEITFSKKEDVRLRDEIDVLGFSWSVSDVIKDDGFLVRVAVKPLRARSRGPEERACE